MKRHNVEFMSNALFGQEEGIKPFEIFDEKYCSMMDDFPQFKPLQKKHWDVIRDMNKVVVSDVCRENEIEFDQICMIDNDEEKLQPCLDKGILVDEYT